VARSELIGEQRDWEVNIADLFFTDNNIVNLVDIFLNARKDIVTFTAADLMDDEAARTRLLNLGMALYTIFELDRRVGQFWSPERIVRCILGMGDQSNVNIGVVEQAVRARVESGKPVTFAVMPIKWSELATSDNDFNFKPLYEAGFRSSDEFSKFSLFRHALEVVGMAHRALVCNRKGLYFSFNMSSFGAWEHAELGVVGASKERPATAMPETGHGNLGELLFREAVEFADTKKAKKDPAFDILAYLETKSSADEVTFTTVAAAYATAGLRTPPDVQRFAEQETKPDVTFDRKYDVAFVNSAKLGPAADRLSVDGFDSVDLRLFSPSVVRALYDPSDDTRLLVLKFRGAPREYNDAHDPAVPEVDNPFPADFHTDLPDEQLKELFSDSRFWKEGLTRTPPIIAAEASYWSVRTAITLFVFKHNGAEFRSCVTLTKT
jgi:hypothetical protein